MEPIFVILGPFSSEPFADGLRYLLTQRAGFQVAELDSTAGLADIVRPDRPAVVVLEGVDPADCAPYLDTAEIVSVVMLDALGARAFVGLDNPDWERLVQVITAVAGEAVRHRGEPVHDRVRTIEPHELASIEDPQDQDPGVGTIIEWLDLRLAWHLRQLDQQQDSRGIPGWSVAPNDALELLGNNVQNLSSAELGNRLNLVDHSLIVKRSTLPAEMAEIAATFSLSDPELRILCLLLGPEIDGRYATSIGVLQDDLTRRRPGLTLLARLLGADEQAWELRRLLVRSGSLRSSGLIEPAAGGSDSLAVDEGYALTPTVLGHLLGEDRSEQTAGTSLLWPEAGDLTAKELALADQLRTLLSGAAVRPIVHLVGHGRSRWFERIVANVSRPLVRGDLRQLEAGKSPLNAIAEWSVLAALHDACLMVVGVDEIDRSERYRVGALLTDLAGRRTLVAIDGEPDDLGLTATQVLRMDAPKMTAGERTQAWMTAAMQAGYSLPTDQARTLGATLRLEDDDIKACLGLYSAANPNRTLDEASLAKDLQQLARQLNQQAIPPAARRIEAVYEWDDIVVPDPIMRSLRTISAHVNFAGQVLEEWGFSRRLPYGQGVAALFSGPSGTGKTMAAQIIAGDLGVDLYQVDLSKTISKYIGETEKNLGRIFDAAERAGAVLLFDEADALFGKRTEVKDAHDRHANVEVAYLLQRMEAFAGLAILTSNLKQNIDQAFLRRLRFVVDFPVPTASERETIWRRCFPQSAPVGADVDIDFLARRLTITGGSIQQIALHAAFAAATENRPIGMENVVAATRRELVKIGMLNAEKSLDVVAA